MQGDTNATIDPGLDGISTAEPVIPSEVSAPFENAAMIGDEKLRSSGFFVNIVRRGAAAPFEGTSPQVLVIEDDPGTVAVIEGVLRKKGMITRSAGTLAEIIRALSVKPHPDIILLDIMLPDANGFAVLERLRRHPELKGVPVVMLTSLSDPADVAKGLALGATGYMSKPARPQALVSAIDVVLGRAARE